MTRQEFAQIVLAITTFYPTENALNSEQSVKLWFEMLKDLDYQDLTIALQKHVTTKRYFPSIAELREACVSVQKGEIATWSEGWAELVDAIRYYGYMREIEGLNSLSEITRRVAQRLRWADLCKSENVMNDRANFRMAYEQEVRKYKERQQLSPKVRELIDLATARSKGGQNGQERIEEKGTGSHALDIADKNRSIPD